MSAQSALSTASVIPGPSRVGLFENKQWLCQNPYPGRGVILGLDEARENFMLLTFGTGRSEDSQNRIYELFRRGGVRTKQFKKKTVSPAHRQLIYYNAHREKKSVGAYAASNGRQTDAAVDNWQNSLEHALSGFNPEPDSNRTPRITMRLLLDKNQPTESSIETLVIFDESGERKSIHRSGKAGQLLSPGSALALVTYRGDATGQLPCFKEDSFFLPFNSSNAASAVDEFRSMLPPELTFFVAAKFIPAKGGESKVAIWNKHDNVPAAESDKVTPITDGEDEGEK